MNHKEIIDQKTVIICSAGLGTRLGLGIPKALLDIDGKPFIVRQLETLEMATDIRVVVGYKADDVIAAIHSYRDDIMIIYNHEYETTNVAYSFSMALNNVREYIIYVDGDLLVDPDDVKSMLMSQDEFICATPISTNNPMKIETFLKDSVIYASDFSYDHGQYEWAGAMNIKSSRINTGDRYICDLLKPLLPLPVRFINAKEVDTMDDYEKFMDWFIDNKNKSCKSRVYDSNVNINPEKTKSFWKQRADKYSKEHPYVAVKLGDSKPTRADEWDVYEKNNILTKLNVNHADYVLDIGCGVGRLAEYIIPQCKYYTGTDFAEELIAIANERISPFFSKERYRFIVEDAINVRLDNPNIPYCGKYSVLILAGILIYLNDDDIKKILHNLLLVLSKECRIYFSEPVAKESRLTLNEFYSHELKHAYSAIYRTENEYMNLFDVLYKNGFMIEEKGDYNQFSDKTSETERIYMILKRG